MTDPLSAEREAAHREIHKLCEWSTEAWADTQAAHVQQMDALKVYEERAQLVGQAAMPCYCSWYEESDALNCDEHDDGPCPSCDARRRLSE